MKILVIVRLCKAAGATGRKNLLWRPANFGETRARTGISGDTNPWPREHLYCPTGDPPLPGSVFPDLLFSASDPEDTGRPIRLIIGRTTVKNGDTLELEELGGYPASEKK